MLFDGDRIVGAALDRGVVDDDHALPPLDAADAGDNATGGHFVFVEAVARQLAQLQEGRAGIEQQAQAFARQELAAREVACPGALAAALGHARDLRPEVVDQRAHGGGVGAEGLAAGVECRREDRHRRPLSTWPALCRRRRPEYA